MRRARALALIDPPNCESITGGAPRPLTYAEADRAISALAAKLRGLGLQTDTVVALQLANTVDSVIALLGVLRAGMIAAPLPLLWRKQEMVAALGRIGAKAIITSSRIGAAAHRRLCRDRHAGGGRAVSDPPRLRLRARSARRRGAARRCVRVRSSGILPAAARPGHAAAHVAAITFDVTGDGLVPVARSQSELIAGGLAVFREAGIAENATILSTIPAASFAGIALTLMPWLLAGGTLALHHGFDPAVFAEQCRAHDTSAVLLPGPALAPLADAGLLGGHIKHILALWRAPEQLAAAAPWQRDAALVDIASFGETGLLPARRGTDGMPAPIPHGAFTAPRAGITAVGFYRFRQREIDALVASASPAAVVVALPDALLGQRLAGSARERAATATELQARGVNPLIAGAFRPRDNAA